MFLRFYFIFCFVFLVTHSALADAVINHSVSFYVTNNIIFQIIYNGGYYSVAAISIIIIICYFSRFVREIVLSLTMAIIAVMLLIWLYEALEDFEYLPTS